MGGVEESLKAPWPILVTGNADSDFNGEYQPSVPNTKGVCSYSLKTAEKSWRMFLLGDYWMLSKGPANCIYYTKSVKSSAVPPESANWQTCLMGNSLEIQILVKPVVESKYHALFSKGSLSPEVMRELAPLFPKSQTTVKRRRTIE